MFILLPKSEMKWQVWAKGSFQLVDALSVVKICSLPSLPAISYSQDLGKPVKFLTIISHPLDKMFSCEIDRRVEG